MFLMMQKGYRATLPSVLLKSRAYLRVERHSFTV